ncbi:glycosyltransferase [Paraburkholderia madseniana]|uniref:glycosyltransferase family 2 protein n=1 Tax=Paraburkholderia madseniana TaxID=2599607 RepID=UPI0015C5410D|nr:glycosyltransferase [Paraburkholderia madseniana]NPT66242.1 glycosyltransferase [Paraburkholderia madseniana]
MLNFELRPAWTSAASAAPIISVVVPLYNHAPYIEAALGSVLSQTSAADEIILIDDGSSDNGFELAQQVLSNVPHAKTFRQENAGAHTTINRGIELSSGDYIAVLNSDDLFAPAKLECCRAILRERRDVGLIAGNLGIIDGNGVRLQSGFAIDWLDRARRFLHETKLPQLALLNENFVATTSNMVFARELWRAAGGFQSLRYCHDLDFLMFACANSSVYLDLEEEHIAYRVHPNNTIWEDQSKVRIEVAAVIAQALCAAGPRLFSADLDEQDLAAFLRVLRNRRLTELVSYFQTVFPAFANRAAFYAHVADSSRVAAFQAALAGGGH